MISDETTGKIINFTYAWKDIFVTPNRLKYKLLYTFVKIQFDISINIK